MTQVPYVDTDKLLELALEVEDDEIVQGLIIIVRALLLKTQELESTIKNSRDL